MHLVREDDARRISTARTSVTTKGPVCDYHLACDRFKKTLGIGESYFSHEADKCFCEACHKARGDDDYYTRGKPKKKYAVPVGWTRFGLSLNPTFKDSELKVFDNWHRAYHGTHPDVVKKILQNSSQLLMPGDVALGGRKLGEKEGHFTDDRKPKGFDTAQVFVTPSIVYAAHDAYANPKKFEDNGKVYGARVAFQLCIRPDSYEVGPETVGARGEGKTIDPLFSNNELEWSTKERGGTALYGLLVKLEPFDEESADDVGFDERLYAELRFSRTFEMLYLLDALAGLRFPDDDDND
ncbi:neuralized-like protein 4 [Branchiostoma floridae x Branchiostoma japonicum]